MNLEEKEKIKKLRQEGQGYKKISKELGLSVNTIKSFCRNNNLTSQFISKESYCKECEKLLIQKENIKKKVFCNDTCKRNWWNKNRRVSHSKTKVIIECKNCSKNFEAYHHENRKYCSHQCYIDSRFRGDCQ